MRHEYNISTEDLESIVVQFSPQAIWTMSKFACLRLRLIIEVTKWRKLF